MQIDVVLDGKTTAAPFPPKMLSCASFLFAIKGLDITDVAKPRFGS
jgi:hypothetical protein